MDNKLISMYKPSGTKVNVNEQSIDAALKLGWTKETPRKQVNIDTMTKQQLVDYAESEFSVFLDVTHTAKRLRNKINELLGD